MLSLESKKVIVSMPPEALFSHLEDLKNLYELMPESVERFEADDSTFLFGMKGMPDVRMLLEEKQSPSLLRFQAASSKLDFELRVHIAEAADNSSELHISFDGNFNAMMKMMVEKPLRNFIEALVEKASLLNK